MKSNIKKILVATLAVVTISLLFCVALFAADRTYIEVDNVRYAEYTLAEVKTYREASDAWYTASSAPTMDGYLFGGWYDATTEEGETYDSTDKQYDPAPLSYLLQTGEADHVIYAKFVPEELLTVKAQVSGYLADGEYTPGDNAAKESGDENGAIRFITSVDSLIYRQIGLEITIGGTTRKVTSNKVYTALKANGMNKDNTSYTVTPQQVFGEPAKYFRTHTFQNCPSTKDYLTDITVSAFWKTPDGTTVEGNSSRTENINQMRYWNYVYVNPDTGNDTTAAGTMLSPFKTISAAMEVIKERVAYQKNQGWYTGKNTGEMAQADTWVVYLSGNYELGKVFGIDDTSGANIVLEGIDPNTYLDAEKTSTATVTFKRGDEYDGELFAVTGAHSLTFDGVKEKADSTSDLITGINSEGVKLIIDGDSREAAESRVATVSTGQKIIVNKNAIFQNHTLNTVNDTNGDSKGGVFKVTGGELTINDGTFTNNQATAGGVVHGRSVAGLVINGGTYTNNKTVNGAGGVFNIGAYGNGVKVSIKDAKFTDNGAPDSSGGVLWIIQETTLEVENCTFDNNKCKYYGGVLGANTTYGGAHTIFNNCTFTNNTTDRSGGVVGYNTTLDNAETRINKITLNNCNFSDNTAERYGNDVFSKNVGEFTLEGNKLPTDITVYLGTADDMLTVAQDFATEDTENKIYLSTMRPLGDAYVTCASSDEAARISTADIFKLNEKLKEFRLENSEKKLLLANPEYTAIVDDKKYTSIQNAVNAIGENGTGTVQIISEGLTDTVTIPNGANITFTDDDDTAVVMRSLDMTSSMFSLGTGSKVTFSSTTKSDETCMLYIEGNAVKTTNVTNVVEVKSGNTVNVEPGAGFFAHEGRTNYYGTVFKVDQGTLNISGGRFEDNIGVTGGVAYATGQTSSVINVTGGKFSYNESVSISTNHGGGVFYMNRGSKLNISGATFSENAASSSSGGVILAAWGGGNVSVKNSTFTNNTAKRGGGAISIGNGTNQDNRDYNLTVDGCTFTGNQGAINDIYVEDIDSFEMAGTFNTPMEIEMASAGDVITATDTFAITSGNVITLSATVADRIAGSALVNCANDAATYDNQIALAGGLEYYTLSYADNKVAIKDRQETNAAIFNGTTYSTLQEAVTAVGANNTGKVTVIGDVLNETVTTPDNSKITLIDDGTTPRAVMRASDFEGADMFTLGTGSTLTFDSTGTDEDSRLFIQGNGIERPTTDGTNEFTRVVTLNTGKTVVVNAGVTFASHCVSKNGAVFHANPGTITINGGVFKNNTSADAAGVLYARNGAVVQITGVTFTENKTTGGAGGVLNIGKSKATITGATFEGNSAAGSGGVFWIVDGTSDTELSELTVENSTFTSNISKNAGGVIGTNDNKSYIKATFKGCKFESNTANKGGVIALVFNETTTDEDGNKVPRKVDFILDNCVFTDNSATNGIGDDIYLENVVANDAYTTLRLNTKIGSNLKVYLATSRDILRVGNGCTNDENYTITLSSAANAKTTGDSIIHNPAADTRDIRSWFTLGTNLTDFTIAEKTSGAYKLQ